MRLNRANALRCGKCDYPWNQCIDYTFVPGGRTRQVHQQEEWEPMDWPWQTSRTTKTRTKSPRARRSGTPRSRRKKEKQSAYSVPELDPPWNGKAAMTAPTVAAGQELSPAEVQAEQKAENKYNRLVAALEKQDGPLDPDVQLIIEENNAKPTSSKTMHSAVTKLDQARKKLRQAQSARSNHQAKWMKYIEESIVRWKKFAEDYAKQDGELESKVTHAKDKLQEARDLFDEMKEKMSKQDEAFLNDAEMISDAEDDTDKMETSEKIQAGINTMVQSLESIRVRPEPEEGTAAKKPRLEGSGGDASTPSLSGSKAMQPFGTAGR